MAKRTFRVLVVAPGANPSVVHDAVTAIAATDRLCVDELHVLVSAGLAPRFRAALLKRGMASVLATGCRRQGVDTGEIIFSSRAIHSVGVVGTPASVADDVLDTLRKVCRDETNDVTVVASSEAGVVSILAHSALQLVGKPADRFFVLDVGLTSPVQPKQPRSRKKRTPLPNLSEVPTILAERPAPQGQSYTELETSRRLAQRRLAQPGTLTLDGGRRALRIDDVEILLPRLQFFWTYCLATLAPEAFPLRLLSGNFHVEGDGRIAIDGQHPHRAQLEVLARHTERVFVTLFPDAADEFPLVFKRACGPTPGLPSLVAKVNAHLRRVLGVGSEPYLLAGGRGTGGYRLTLPPAQIELMPASAPQKRRVHQ